MGETEEARIREALEGMEGRSPLYDWLRKNRGLLEARFAVSRPRWGAVAKVLSDLGVRDGAGQAPAASTVRQAWYRVRTRPPKEVPEPSLPAAVAPVRPFPSPASPPPRSAPFDPTEGAFDPKPPPRFKPASLK